MASCESISTDISLCESLAGLVTLNTAPLQSFLYSAHCSSISLKSAPGPVPLLSWNHLASAGIQTKSPTLCRSQGRL